ncbi:MarR family winged helix-turn-helix transcriptional regulator [Pelagibacterium lacus]|nr:MarR family transcriptional regulator [Pelagibacterium lacus]
MSNAQADVFEAPDDASSEKDAARPEIADKSLMSLIEEMPLWRRPGYLIRRLNQLHYALFFEECGKEITPVQYGLLTILSSTSDSDQISIANRLGIDRTNVADVLRRLVTAGLVRRERSKTDRRAMIAMITPEGEKLLERMHPAMVRAQERILEGLSPDERTVFIDLLIRLLAANNEHGRAALKLEKPED